MPLPGVVAGMGGSMDGHIAMNGGGKKKKKKKKKEKLSHPPTHPPMNLSVCTSLPPTHALFPVWWRGWGGSMDGHIAMNGGGKLSHPPTHPPTPPAYYLPSYLSLSSTYP